MAPKGKGKGKGKGNGKGNPKNQNQSHRNTTASASTAAAAGRVIPQKLLFNILTRLPVKSLLRFKCVSKQWRTLTSLPSFASAHLSRAPSSILIHTVQDDQPNRDGEDNPNQPARVRHCICTYRPLNPNLRSSNEAIHDFPGSGIEPFDYYFEVIGSTPNGIVCVSQKQFGENLTLWNPATGLSRSIRAPKLKGDPARHSGASIGLCYDPSQNDIKIVRILCHKVEQLFADVVEFYSLKSGAWTVLKMDDITPFCISSLRCDAMFEGVPYWRCVIYKESILGTMTMLLSFRPEKLGLEMEDFGVVLKTRDSPVCMGEIQGCLAAVTWDMLGGRKDAYQVLDVWLRYKTVGWKKLYRIDPMPVIGRVLGMYGDWGIVLEKENGDGNLDMFHLKERVLEETLVADNQILPGLSLLLNYKESLTRITEPGCSMY